MVGKPLRRVPIFNGHWLLVMLEEHGVPVESRLAHLTRSGYVAGCMLPRSGEPVSGPEAGAIPSSQLAFRCLRRVTFLRNPPRRLQLHSKVFVLSS